jgi:SAM-dependent methyltransferase
MLNRLLAVPVKASKIFSRKGLYEFLAAQFASIPEGAKVLSVGAGGDVNARLRKQGQVRRFSVVELDIDPARGPDLVGDVCTYPLGEAEFDVVLISEVLEHLHSPHLAIENLARALRVGGHLILTTPFVFPIHERPYDYFRYTRFGLEFLLRDFDDVRITPRNSYFEAIDVMWLRLVQTESTGARLAGFLIVPLIFLKWPLTKLLSVLIRTDAATSGYTVSARKGRGPARGAAAVRAAAGRPAVD